MGFCLQSIESTAVIRKILKSFSLLALYSPQRHRGSEILEKGAWGLGGGASGVGLREAGVETRVLWPAGTGGGRWKLRVIPTSGRVSGIHERGCDGRHAGA